MIPPYLMEVFVRSKAAWGGGAVIICVGIIEHSIGHSLSGIHYAMALMFAVIGAQFWNGLMQFERMRPRFDIRRRDQQFWNLREQRGSFGTGHYFEVFNPSVGQSLECVRAELVSIEPRVIDILPFPLHIRHLPYCTTETFINPQCSREFDLATGPSHHEGSQAVIMIPGIIGGDRGWTNGVPIPFGVYRLGVRVSARNCKPIDLSFEISVDEDKFLRCSECRPSASEVL